jgi:hypothetical protein
MEAQQPPPAAPHTIVRYQGLSTSLSSFFLDDPQRDKSSEQGRARADSIAEPQIAGFLSRSTRSSLLDPSSSY